MAPGANFTLVPNLVEPLEPVYNVVVSESESMKKEFLAMSTTARKQYRLLWNALPNTDRETLDTHFTDNTGGYYPFTWASVPTYIGSGANLTGRWVAGTLSITPAIRGQCWAVSIVFEVST